MEGFKKLGNQGMILRLKNTREYQKMKKIDKERLKRKRLKLQRRLQK